MITVFVRGGLGNQMFQYAMGLSVAKRRGVPLQLDTTFLNDRFPRKNFAYRNFSLDAFNAPGELSFFSRASKSLPIPGVWLGLDLAWMHARNALHMLRIVKEGEEHLLDPTVFEQGDNVIFWGRWQNPEYFNEIANDVRAAFTLKNGFSGPAVAASETIRNANAVSIHIRRGDFAAFASVKQFMGDTDLSYYDRAARFVAGKVTDPQFFVFSDDPAWCRENLKLGFPTEYLGDDTAGPDGVYHLALMAQCKHHIIANSTFSWWGAWLGANPQKIVVAPERWYADGSRNGGAGILPPEWIKM